VDTVFHIARAVDWYQAKRDGAYRISILGKRLDEQGYIHLSFAPQVKPVADRFYRGMEDLSLLELEPDRLTAPVVIEPGDGTDERSPICTGNFPSTRSSPPAGIARTTKGTSRLSPGARTSRRRVERQPGHRRRRPDRPGSVSGHGAWRP
jgi:uncharacterized protein (DUF952 family)